MTTTRRRFTTQDVQIVIDCGIEWGTPVGSVRFKKFVMNSVVATVEINGRQIYAIVTTTAQKLMKQINAYISVQCN